MSYSVSIYNKRTSRMPKHLPPAVEDYKLQNSKTILELAAYLKNNVTSRELSNKEVNAILAYFFAAAIENKINISISEHLSERFTHRLNRLFK